MSDPINENIIVALLDYLRRMDMSNMHAGLSALVAERNALQAKINAHAEDRRRYIDAWEGWIASTKRLGIAEWLRVYADAVPIPSLNGDEAKERVFKHLDQRMRDAAETIDELRKRIEELESHPPAASDLRERLVCAIWPEIMRQWREYKDAIDPRGDARSDALVEADKMIAAMRKGDQP